MGNLLGYGQSTEPDPNTGLSPRDKYLVSSNWAILKQDLKSTGVNLMLAYLTEFPEYQSYFPFKDIPLNDLKSTPKFRAHCANLIYALSAIIDSLDDVESLISLLVKAGDSHKKHGAPADGFNDLKTTLFKFLKAELTFRYTEECDTAWKKTVDVAFKIITEKLD